MNKTFWSHFIKIKKYALKNGLTVLVKPVAHIPKVSIQLWYNVGSKDEKTGERGLAHLLEHMIFKGTEVLSESDINLITHKLSGSTNAFTTYDYTGYMFDFPKQNWEFALQILADCMKNCTFKQDLLNAEMKSVIQELKMYRDDYEETLLEKLMESIFSDHPYHYPVIGYKHDLWDINRKKLLDFYHKHYIPNNATLFVIGDVEPEEVYKKAKKYFEAIPANLSYKKETFYFNSDIYSTCATIYRDVVQPEVMVGWAIPGMKEKKGFLFDVLAWLIGSGRGSVLYKKLVDEEKLVSNIETFTYDLVEKSLFVIQFRPINRESISTIIKIINQEIESLAKNISEKQLKRAIKKAEVAYLNEFTTTEKQAFFIGELYLATNDEQYPLTYNEKPEDLVPDLQKLIKNYLRPTLMHKAMIVPLPTEEKSHWIEKQKESDAMDTKILTKKIRECSVEDGVFVHTMEAKKPIPFVSPDYKKIKLSNGLEVIYFNSKKSEPIEIILTYKGNHLYDPANLSGLSNFVAQMLIEGTKNYSGSELSDVLEGYGMHIDIKPGKITVSCLPVDLEKALELLTEIIARTTFEQKEIAKVREQIISNINDFWDDPKRFIVQLAKEKIYKGHPYSNLWIGKKQVIDNVGRTELIDFYSKYISPQGACMAIVGNLTHYDMHALLQKTINQWSGPELNDIAYPQIEDIKKEVIHHEINRDQTILGYTGLSVKRLSKDFDALLLFEQILTGGLLGSMSSKLFQLREQTGLFYTIGGSLVLGANKQQGIILIKAITSKDDLKKAERLIEQEINYAIDSVTEKEFEQAKNAIINTIMNFYETNLQMAESFLFLEKYNLPKDYFDKRAEDLENISIQEMKETVKKYLDNKKLLKITVGRA